MITDARVPLDGLGKNVTSVSMLTDLVISKSIIHACNGFFQEMACKCWCNIDKIAFDKILSEVQITERMVSEIGTSKKRLSYLQDE